MWTRRKKIEVTAQQPVTTSDAEPVAPPANVASSEEAEIKDQQAPSELSESTSTPVVQVADQEEDQLVPLAPIETAAQTNEAGVRKIILRMGQSKLEVNNVTILSMDINQSVLTIDIREVPGE